MYNLITRILRRYTTGGGVARSIIISESNDIYTNLALEDWFYRNRSFEREQLLMLWSNNPCVVIGKFQNPWLEANISELDVITTSGVKLARRNSGGGTVYHDRGNLNLTFFTARGSYKRKTNLEVIRRAVLRDYGLAVEISQREDLMVEECKISGTASKLGRLTAYHHCTLLVNADKNNLSKSLKKPTYEIKTNATRSTRAEIANLRDFEPRMTVGDLMVSIGQEYLRGEVLHPPQNHGSIGQEYLHGEALHPPQNDENNLTKFRILRPNEDEFPGLTEIRDGLLDWNWNFGKCPKFTATKQHPSTISLVVENGFVTQVSNLQNPDADVVLTDEFSQRKFGEHLFDEVHDYLKLIARSSSCVT